MKVREIISEKASEELCKSARSNADLGASNLASCKSQGWRAREGNKSHLIGHGKSSVRITVGGKKIKGKTYGGPLPDYGTRKRQLKEAKANPSIIKLQQELKAKGYDLGPYGPKGDGIDGIMGPYTQAAKDAYEKGIDPKDVKKPNTADVQRFDAAQDKIEPSSGGDVVPTQGRLTGKYGRMVTGPNGNKIPHPGVDIAAPEGTPVVAPENGKITLIKLGSPSAGNYIEMITANGEKHRFLHLSKIEVGRGDVVKKGDLVGRVGSTGFSTGNHLHWEKYSSSGQQLDPLA